MPAFRPCVGVLHADQFEILFPVRTFLVQRDRAEAGFHPHDATVGQLARLSHVVLVLVTGNRAASEITGVDGPGQRRPPTGPYPRRDQISHTAMVSPSARLVESEARIGYYARMRSRRIGALVGLMVLLAVPCTAAQRTDAPRTSPADTGRVAGRVVRSDGLPQPEAEVVLARRDGHGALAQLSWRARSAFDGRYEIAGVPPGRYLVLVRAIGGDSGGAGRPHPTLFPGVPVTEPGTLIDVVPGLSTEGIDIWLWPDPRRFTVSGRVFGPEGAVFDSLTLEFGRPGTRATDVWTTTDPGGLFSIETAPPGALVVRARATAGDRVFVGIAATTVAVTPVEDIRINVREPVAIAGQVRAEGGRRLPPGLSVTLVPEALGPSALYPAERALVAEDGRFALHGEPGTLKLAIQGLPEGWLILGINGKPQRALIHVAAGPVEPVDVVVGPKVP